MSRSTKKPFYTDQQNGSSGFIKRKASRAVRATKLEDTPKSGKSYRKVFNPWQIRDWSFFSSEPKAKRK